MCDIIQYMSKSILLSVVVTVHNEGLIAHKTMKSIFAATEILKNHNKSFEIIIHIDNGDDITNEYFTRYKNSPEIKIFSNSFSDPGPSRNFAVQKSKGSYVAFVDGDDLISSNWLIEGLNILESSKKETIVHPEAVLTFGVNQPNTLSIYKESFSKDEDTLILLGENRWGSVIMAKKETLLKFPYKHLKKGFGHEDYVFSIETVEGEIDHKVAKNTVLFYRRSDHSRLSSSNNSHVIIPPVNLFDFQMVKKIKKLHKPSSTVSLRDYGYKIYKKIRGNNFLNFFITPPAKIVLKILNRYGRSVDSKNIPSFVIKEWIDINKIETQLYPYPSTIKNLQFYCAENQAAVGSAFWEASQHISHLPDYIFIVPWIVRGGADKVLFNYINALKEIHKNWKITVIATLPAKNTWSKSLPEFVDFIDFGNISNSLNPYAQDILFSRIITQLRCNKLHIINSEYCYFWVMRHKELIGNNFKLNVSLFASEFIRDSNMKGVFSYDNPHLFEIYQVVNKIFTDNQNIITEAIERNGFSEEKFKLHYQPINYSTIKKIERKVPSKKFHILWASRVTKIKLPDILLEISKRLDPEKFQIDVFGEFSDDIKVDFFNNSPTIKYRGSFDGFHNLPTNEYDLYLYTSLTDGMPNTILEAAAAGLPIIASNDGGVKEFIQNNKTGILIQNLTDAVSYVKAIENIYNKPDILYDYAKNAQNLLRKRHLWDKFIDVLQEDF